MRGPRWPRATRQSLLPEQYRADLCHIPAIHPARCCAPRERRSLASRRRSLCLGPLGCGAGGSTDRRGHVDGRADRRHPRCSCGCGRGIVLSRRQLQQIGRSARLLPCGASSCASLQTCDRLRAPEPVRCSQSLSCSACHRQKHAAYQRLRAGVPVRCRGHRRQGSSQQRAVHAGKRGRRLRLLVPWCHGTERAVGDGQSWPNLRPQMRPALPFRRAPLRQLRARKPRLRKIRGLLWTERPERPRHCQVAGSAHRRKTNTVLRPFPAYSGTLWRRARRRC